MKLGIAVTVALPAYRNRIERKELLTKPQKDKMTSPQFYIIDTAYVAECISGDSYSSVKYCYVLVYQHPFFSQRFQQVVFQEHRNILFESKDESW